MGLKLGNQYLYLAGKERKQKFVYRTRKRHKIIVKIIIPALFAGMLFSCSNNLEEIKEVTSKSDGPDEITEGVIMLFTDMGKSKLKLESPLVYRFLDMEKMKIECPNGMKVTFYDTLENIESVLTANYGLLLSEDQYLKVEDSVVFQNNKKDRLDTELLNIYFEKDSIYTDKFVKVSTENGVISGTGLVSNSNFTQYELLNIRDSHYNVNEKKEDEQNE
jgi:LPS export ABC transporter protein LptC